MGDYQENAFGSRMYAQGLYDESSTQKHRLGTVRQLDDGRKFVYAQATAASLVAGIVVSKAVAVQACTVAAADAAINLAGARDITLTLTGTPTSNLYRDGILINTAGTAIGEAYKIKGNTADDNPATGRCTINLYDALKTTMVAASTTCDIIENPYDGVLINPAVAANGAGTSHEKPLGVTTRPVTASYYFWAQTAGLASLQMDIDSAAGAEDNECIVQPGTTEGHGFTVHDTSVPGFHKIGELVLSVDYTNNEAGLVNLCIS